MSLEVITQLGVSEKAKDTYPILSLVGVTKKLIPMKIFPQRKAITNSIETLKMVHIKKTLKTKRRHLLDIHKKKIQKNGSPFGTSPSANKILSTDKIYLAFIMCQRLC